MELFAVGVVVLEGMSDLEPGQEPPAAGRLARSALAAGWRVRVTRSVAAVPGIRRKREGMSGPGSMGYLTLEREIVCVRGRVDQAAWYQCWERDLPDGGWGTAGGSVRDADGYRMLTVKGLERYLAGEG